MPKTEAQTRQENKPATTADSDLIARLKAAESELAEKQAKIDELESERVDSALGLKYKPSAKPYAGDNGGYEFTVNPYSKSPKHAHLKPMTVKAVDESEAKRFYFESHESHPGSGMALDPVTVGLRIEVTCNDTARQESILLQKKLAAVRRKLENNIEMTDEDNRLLNEYEDRIMRL